MQTFKQMKEDSGKQAQLNAQMAKLLRKRDKEHAHQQEELAGAQAKAVQLAAENQKLREQVRLFLLSTQPELMQAVCTGATSGPWRHPHQHWAESATFRVDKQENGISRTVA